MKKFTEYTKQDVTEGAKVDRMVKYVKQSEKKLGHSDKEAENIAWATANKRGMLDNKQSTKEEVMSDATPKKLSSWKSETPWHKSKKTDNESGRGKVAHLSDKARRETENKNKDVAEEAMSAAPTNAVGSGAIAGSGGAGGEPGVSKKRNPLMSFLKRKQPKM